MPAALARTAATGMLSVKRTGTARPSASERVSRTGQPQGSAISAASPESAIAQSRGGAAAGRPAPPARSLRQVLAHRLELEPFLLGLGEPLLPHVQRLGGLAELHRLAGIEVGVREQPLELADLRLQPLDLPGQVV